jgi:hypothetical protein
VDDQSILGVKGKGRSGQQISWSKWEREVDDQSTLGVKGKEKNGQPITSKSEREREK